MKKFLALVISVYMIVEKRNHSDQGAVEALLRVEVSAWGFLIQKKVSKWGTY